MGTRILNSNFQKTVATNLWQTLLVVLICLYAPGEGVPALDRSSSRGKIPWVSFCDLLKNPMLYEGKQVRTKAVYRHGGEELAELYCAECLAAGRVSADFDQSFDPNNPAKIVTDIERERTVSLIIVGKFYSGDKRYGHLNQYRSKFVMSRIEKAKVLLNSITDPTKLPKRTLARFRCNS
jgi:hypothetical protein